MPFATVLLILKRLIIVPVGTMSPFSLEDNPSKTVKELVEDACLRSTAWHAHAPRFLRFILVVSFSDTLLMASTLRIV